MVSIYQHKIEYCKCKYHYIATSYDDQTSPTDSTSISQTCDRCGKFRKDIITSTSIDPNFSKVINNNEKIFQPFLKAIFSIPKNINGKSVLLVSKRTESRARGR